MNNELHQAIDNLLNTCQEVATAQKRLGDKDTGLRRAVQHQKVAAQAVKDLMNHEDSESTKPN